MEGYFPIYEYCKITGANKNTAYRRAERGTLESFKGKDGRWFVYYSDNRTIPEGYISTEEYAKKVGVCRQHVEYRIRSGYFKDDETITSIIINEKGQPQKRRLIREDTEWIDYRGDSNRMRCTSIMESLRPEGTYTVKEYAKMIKREPCIIYNRIKNGIIHFIKVGGHVFIYPDNEEVTA